MSELTDDEIENIYLKFLSDNAHIKTIPQMAAALDLDIEQVENLLELIRWYDGPRIAKNIPKARAEDARPACVILPFMRLTNND